MNTSNLQQKITKFLGDGWTIKSDISTKKNFDVNKLVFHTGLDTDEQYVTGEVKLKRLANTPLFGIDTFFKLYEEKGQKTLNNIYDKYKVNWMEFLGTTLRSPGGNRYALYLCRRDDGSWYWLYYWLDSKRNVDNPAVGLASPLESVPESLSDTKSLELRVAKLEAWARKEANFINPYE